MGLELDVVGVLGVVIIIVAVNLRVRVGLVVADVGLDEVGERIETVIVAVGREMVVVVIDVNAVDVLLDCLFFLHRLSIVLLFRWLDLH